MPNPPVTDPFRRNVLATLLGIVGLTLSGVASGKHADAKYWEHWWDITEERFRGPWERAILPILLRHLSDAERDVVKQVSVVWDRTLLAGDTRVRYLSGRYQIRLSLTALTIVSWLNDARLFYETYAADPAEYVDYLHFISERLPTFEENVRKGKAINDVEVLPLYEISNIRIDKWRPMMSRSDLQPTRIASDMSALGFIYCHEVAHVLLKHIPRTVSTGPGDTLKQEYEADLWAIDHMVNFGLDPLGAADFLFLFFQSDVGLEPQNRTHEVANCRGFRVKLYGRERLLARRDTTTMTTQGAISDKKRQKILSEISRLRELAKTTVNCDVTQLNR